MLRIEARTDGQRMRISVENPFDPDAPPRPGRGRRAGQRARAGCCAGYGDRARVDAERGRGPLPGGDLDAGGGGRVIRVLIVDDEAPARALLREMLSAEPDVEILGEAATGLEAVKAAAELKPEAMFLDIEMPKLDGFEVLELLDPADRGRLRHRLRQPRPARLRGARGRLRAEALPRRAPARGAGARARARRRSGPSPPSSPTPPVPPGNTRTAWW